MADLTNYAGLCATIEEWLGRDDLKGQIPVFIQLAEKRMNRELRLRVMERRAETDVPAGQPAVPLPWRREAGNWDVFMEMRDIVWQGADGMSHSLTYAPVDDYAETRTTGLPRQYTIIGRDLFLLPASDADGKLMLTYYAEIPPLGEKQPDNAVLLTAPDVYLYGALLESVPFTRGSVPSELWAQFYSGAKAKLESSEQRARFTSNLTMRPVRRT
jgi:hypothetical protein